MSKQRISSGVKALLNDKGGEFTAGFMDAQLGIALSYMPKNKQKEFMAQFESTVGNVVTVKVKNCMSGKEVEIRWDQVGGPCDPSTERYHTM